MELCPNFSSKLKLVDFGRKHVAEKNYVGLEPIGVVLDAFWCWLGRADLQVKV